MKLSTAAALFVVGVAAAFGTATSLESIQVQIALIVGGSAITALFLLQRMSRRSRGMVALVALILLLGFARGAHVESARSQDWKNVPADGEPVAITGWLDDDARSAGSGVRLSLRTTSVNGEAADFPLTVFASGLTDLMDSARSASGFRYGDVYRFDGRFSTATGNFAESSAGTVFTGVVSLVASDQGNPARRLVAGIREWLSGNLSRTLSEPASALARTMLVNDRTGLDEELNLDFRESGTAHILAISGLHVALIGGLAFVASASIFGRRGQYYLLLPFLVTIAYAALAGLSPSVTRAAIMFSVALLARAIGRQTASLPAIGFAAAVMVLVSPEILRSLSFQLSFAAIAGIALLTPRLIDGANNLFPRLKLNEPDGNRFVSALAAGFAVSIAATLVTWPLVAVNFGGAPVWGGIATILMLPAVPLLIVISALSALLGGLSVQLGEVIGWPVWLLGEFIVGVASFFRDVPPGVVDTTGWTAATAVAAYALIFTAFNWRIVRDQFSRLGGLRVEPFSQNRYVRSGVPIWTILVAVTVAAVLWAGAITSASGNDLKITFFETDRGDMILVQTPNGNSALIDGGRDPFGAIRKLDAALPFWDRTLDVLIVTHPDADHIGGLQAVIERYDVAMIAEVPTEHASTVHAAWRRAIDELPESSVALSPGSLIALDDDVTLEVLSGGRPFPDATINDASLVMMLRYGDASVLLTGDITSLVERRLLDSGHDLSSTVLKVPHHGSDTSSTQPFLDAVDPEIAIVQVGTDNRFGHPTDEVMARLNDSIGNESVFVTSRHGDVTITTDGKRVRVEADR